MSNKKYKYIIETIILSLMLLKLIGNATASDTYSFSITCIIPAIPGVNVPLEEKDDYIQRENKEEQNTIFSQQEKETITTKEKKEGILLKTIYSR